MAAHQRNAVPAEAVREVGVGYCIISAGRQVDAGSVC
jgi:hypothetical protein